MGDYYAELARLKRRGYQAEVVVVGASEITFDVDQNKVVTPSYTSSTTYNLRVIKDHRVGQSSSPHFNNALVEHAVQMALLSQRDKNMALPSVPSTGASVVNLEFKLNDSLDSLRQQMIDLAVDTPEWDLAGAKLKAGNYSKKVVSTEGVDIGERRSALSMEMGIYTHSSTGEPMPDVWDGGSSTAMNIDINGIKASIERKMAALNGRVKNDRKYDEVVLTAYSAGQLLSALVEPAFTGGNLYWKSTPLRPGMKIGNADISILDDPEVKYSVDSRTFDLEGQRRRPITMLRDGKVESFLYDTYWARKAGAKGTASSGGAANIVVSSKEEKDVTQDALVVDYIQGVNSADPTTGKFSVNAGIAWRPSRGGTVGVRDVIISGDLVSLLRGIQSMSTKKKSTDGVVVGDIRVRGLSVG